MTRGYFAISAVGTFHNSAEFADLALVPDEAKAMREALTGLGLTEMCRAPDGELTHEELYTELGTSPGPPGEGRTLVLYCTGHGHAEAAAGWLLVPPDPGAKSVDDWMTPAKLLRAVLRRRDVSQVLLILDACYAGDGAREALANALESVVQLGSATDVWVVAAARRLDEAQQMTFVPAFVDALERQARKNLAVPYLDPSTVTDLTAELMKRNAEQMPWVAAGYQAGGCRTLPNPRFMPPEPPTDEVDRQWSTAARGVAEASHPGWYFTGRDDILRRLADHLQGDSPPEPVLLSAGAGTGKTAILGRLLTAATAEARQALPPVARYGQLPTGDVPITALSVDGLDAASAAEDLADALALPARDLPGLLAALAQRTERLALAIDDVDAAGDPAGIVEEFLRPLAALPCVRLVAAARDTSVEGFREVELPDAGPAIEEYVRTRLTYASASSGRTVSAQIADACRGNFSAAVVAVDSLLRDLRAKPMRDALAESLRAADRRLDALCRRAMRGWATDPDELVTHLAAACSYSPDGRLPADLWAAVTSRLTGHDYTPGEVTACATAAAAFLDGSTLWRPRFGYVGRADERFRVAEVLVDEARQRYGPRWTGCPDEVTAILLGVATEADGRFASLLDEAPLLLAAPAPLVTRELRKTRARVDGRDRIATWAGVPVGGDPRDRALLLGLLGARNNLPQLVGDTPVLWAHHVTSPERPSPLTRSAVAGNLLVTAHDDASVRWWDSRSGTELRAWPPPGTRWTDAAVTGLAAAGPLTTVVTGDHQSFCWGPTDTAAPRALPGPATLTAVHVAGAVAVVHGSAVVVLDGASGVEQKRHSLPDEVLLADFAGPTDRPVLWLVDRVGRAWRWDLRAGGRRPSVVSLCPSPLALACSREDDATVVVDMYGRLTLPTFAAEVAWPETAAGELRSAAVTARWLVLGGGPDRRSGWLEIHPVSDRRPATRWPVDGMVIGLGVAGDLVFVATSGGLAALRLSGRTRLRGGGQR
ncbi:ATP-binding protein [Plantactinospora sonchi]|uniref:ATP-binding protein n=1 Tax=Plantactinospora sonchi TaxID=1544735 RepID=A0ABU7RR35_9ACTN